MSFLGDLVSGFFGNQSANKQADAIVDATKLASKTQMDMFDKSVALNEPFRLAGLNALGAQGALLGYSNMVPQSAINASITENSSPNVWASYGQANPDVMAAWNNPQVQRQFGGDQTAYLQWHYKNIGQSEGRKIPSVGIGGTQTGGTAGSVGYAGTPQDAYDAFNNSGFARSMLETTNADFDQMVGAFGAGGNALSGSAIGALNDRNRRNTSSAFNNYYNALSGISGTGANIGAQQGQQAIQTGNSIADNQKQIGNTRASSYAIQGQNNANMVNGGMNALAAWFGGM